MFGVNEPPKDAFVTQAVTSPFNVALISVEPEMNLPVEVSVNWKNAVQTYKVLKGEFEYSGGFTGRGQKFDVEGTIQLFNFENYATVIFSLSGKGNENARQLFDAGSGTLKEGKIDLARLDAGSFSEGPKPPVRVMGTLSKDKLLLSFEPLPPPAADGFEVRGSLEAIKTK